jgi:hypothetical protein
MKYLTVVWKDSRLGTLSKNCRSSKNPNSQGHTQWLTPVILPIQEVEMGEDCDSRLVCAKSEPPPSQQKSWAW